MSSTIFRLPVLVVSVALVCAFANVVSANIIIDDFTTGEATVTANVPNTTTYGKQTDLPTGHVAGGVRHEDFTVNQYAMPAVIQIAGGYMSWTTGNSSTYWNIIYNGNPGGPGHTPAMSLNLTEYEKFELSVTRADRAINGHIRVRSGNSFPSAYVQIPGPGLYSIDLADFGSVNWASISMIRLEFSSGYHYSGPDRHTITFSDFRVVPEPASITLLLAAGGLLLRQGKK